jgi:hypothetical protein
MAAPYYADPARIAREKSYLARFRERYVAATPTWYRGEYHLLATMIAPLGTLAFCIPRMHALTVWEWLLIVPIFLFGNWCEWAGHRFLMHRPAGPLAMIYKRHCGTHHQFFTDHDLTYKGHKHWRALVFPPFAPVMFLLAALPFALIAGAVWSANAGYMIMVAMAAYYMMYEGLHTLSHLSDERHPYLKHIPLINTVRRMHITHHALGFMQTRNFNLTFPICDALFGTSDLDRGVLATLFNGASHAHVKKELKLDDPPADVGEAAEAAKAKTTETRHVPA